MRKLLKSVLQRLLMGVDSMPQFVAVDAPALEDEIEVLLVGIGSPQDVTRNCVVVSLKPLMFAIGIPSGISAAQLSEHQLGQLGLLISEQALQRIVLGRIDLRFASTIDLPNVTLALFTTNGHANYCLSRVRRHLYHLYQWRLARRNRDPFNFQMARSDLHSLALFYIHARPVVLVTVVCGDKSNLFPMDLIGPVSGPYFLMALRSTSPAVELMKQSRRIALCSMSLGHTQTIYDLGKHHHLERIDWDLLPFKTKVSPTLDLPIPSEATTVAEHEIIAVYSVGSHTLFVTSCIETTRFMDGGQMGHRAGFYKWQGQKTPPRVARLAPCGWG